MRGTILYDFGDMVRTGAARAPEDEPNTELMEIDLDFFRALASGFLRGCAQALNETERELLYLAPQVLTWCQSIRFLADYLNGDTYYKIEHREHNLQRARAQLALLGSMKRNGDRMRSYIA